MSNTIRRNVRRNLSNSSSAVYPYSILLNMQGVVFYVFLLWLWVTIGIRATLQAYSTKYMIDVWWSIPLKQDYIISFLLFILLKFNLEAIKYTPAQFNTLRDFSGGAFLGLRWPVVCWSVHHFGPVWNDSTIGYTAKNCVQTFMETLSLVIMYRSS